MAQNMPAKWDIETEVVVVGYGAAGSTAAITASDSGAEVILIEKSPQGGGNSCVSGGNIVIPESKKFFTYLNTLNFNMTDPAIVEMFVEKSAGHEEWIKKLGGELAVFRPLAVAYPMPLAGASFPQVEGADYMAKYVVKGDPSVTPGRRLFNLLSRNVESRPIKVMLETPAKRLVKNDAGEIIGVIAESKGQPLAIKASKAVILTCGGFEADPEMKWDALPGRPTQFVGHVGNTGDGLRMAQDAGAALWHMTGQTTVLGFKHPDYEASFFVIFLDPGYIYVDKHGKRFIGESEVETHEFWRCLSHFDTDRIEYPRIPFYAIFDDQTRKMGPISSGTAGYNASYADHKWSLDNSEEIEKGWIISAKSISELAAKISIDKATLEATVSRYNKECKKGAEMEFHRAKENVRALEGNRYYAVQLYPALLNTCGGPRRDIEAHVVDAFGKAIPRLYSAGELGSIWGFLYQGANSLSECMVFGQIAGRNAAAETRLS